MSETSAFIIFFAFFLLILIVRKPLFAFVSGKKGELIVKLRLRMLSSERYKVINNLFISNHGQTSQIDHVVVSEYGIFVIETKNYKGWIYGGANSDYWTQNIYGNKYQLYNPLQQNQSHIKALKYLLKDMPSNVFVSIVAFSRKATLKNKSLDNVVYWNQINRVIRSYSQRKISVEQVQHAYDTLMEANIESIDARKHHVQNIRKQKYRHNLSIDNGRCPHCGEKLVLRNGKYGDFYGCSNYPHCKFTKHL